MSKKQFPTGPTLFEATPTTRALTQKANRQQRINDMIDYYNTLSKPGKYTHEWILKQCSKKFYWSPETCRIYLYRFS